MGIQTGIITGDKPVYAKAIAGGARGGRTSRGGDPRTRMAFDPPGAEGGRLVAMTGDGTTTSRLGTGGARGLAYAPDQGGKEGPHMVDLDANPTNLIEIVEIASLLTPAVRSPRFIIATTVDVLSLSCRHSGHRPWRSASQTHGAAHRRHADPVPAGVTFTRVDSSSGLIRWRCGCAPPPPPPPPPPHPPHPPPPHPPPRHAAVEWRGRF